MNPKRYVIGFSLIMLVIFTSGCVLRNMGSGFTEDHVTFDQVRIDRITENVLQAYNENNYTKFTKDMSGVMIKAISESRFDELVNLVSISSGKYLSKELASSMEDRGYVVYIYVCEFEKEPVQITISFKLGYYEIEGLYFDSVNIRSNM